MTTPGLQHESALEMVEDSEKPGRDEEQVRLVEADAEPSGVPSPDAADPESKWTDRFTLATSCTVCCVCGLILLFPILLTLGLLSGWFDPWLQPKVYFFVIGDWGRNGQENQTAVAVAMALRAQKTPPQFVISVGDNMYESGLTSTDDDQFRSSFMDVYHQPSLQVPWHVILGNHDYGEFWDDTIGLKQCPPGEQSCYLSPLHQLHEALIERDRRWHCERSFTLSLGAASCDLFFIDTNPAILEYRTQPWAANRGGILEQSWESQLLELDARLAVSEAEWKIVIGHHPVRNNHQPWNTPELIEDLEPLLKKRGVQAYFSGHEHNLQHIHEEGARTHYIVSGAGSKTDYFPEAHWDNGGSRFQHQGSGFVACQLGRKSLDCDYLSIADSHPIYRVSIPRR